MEILSLAKQKLLNCNINFLNVTQTMLQFKNNVTLQNKKQPFLVAFYKQENLSRVGR